MSRVEGSSGDPAAPTLNLQHSNAQPFFASHLQLPDQVQQRLPRQSQLSRGPAAISSGAVQRVGDEVAPVRVHAGAIAARPGRRGADGPHALRQHLQRHEGRGVAERHRLRHGVLQLAHVARPSVGRDRRRGLRGERQGALPVVAGVALEKVPREKQRVPAALAQGRQPDHRNVEAVEEILPEAPGLDVPSQVARRRRNDADVDRTRAVLADAPQLPFLERPQELDLQGRVEIADLVEEDRPAGSLFEQSPALLLRSGECAPRMAEQLALEDAARNRRDVHGRERARRAAREAMNRSRHGFFSRARLAEDHDGDVLRRESIQPDVGLLHRRVAGHDPEPLPLVDHGSPAESRGIPRLRRSDQVVPIQERLEKQRDGREDFARRRRMERDREAGRAGFERMPGGALRRRQAPERENLAALRVPDRETLEAQAAERSIESRRLARENREHRGAQGSKRVAPNLGRRRTEDARGELGAPGFPEATRRAFAPARGDRRLRKEPRPPRHRLGGGIRVAREQTFELVPGGARRAAGAPPGRLGETLPGEPLPVASIRRRRRGKLPRGHARRRCRPRRVGGRPLPATARRSRAGRRRRRRHAGPPRFRARRRREIPAAGPAGSRGAARRADACRLALPARSSRAPRSPTSPRPRRIGSRGSRPGCPGRYGEDPRVRRRPPPRARSRGPSRIRPFARSGTARRRDREPAPRAPRDPPPKPPSLPRNGRSPARARGGRAGRAPPGRGIARRARRRSAPRAIGRTDS